MAARDKAAGRAGPVLRGQVYWAELGPVGRGRRSAGVGEASRGGAYRGRRPVVIVQNDIGNELSPTTIVVPLSTKSRPGFPLHVRVSSEEMGGLGESWARCEQLLTVAQDRLGAYVGRLGPETKEELDEALRRSLAL